MLILYSLQALLHPPPAKFSPPVARHGNSAVPSRSLQQSSSSVPKASALLSSSGISRGPRTARLRGEDGASLSFAPDQGPSSSSASNARVGGRSARVPRTKDSDDQLSIVLSLDSLARSRDLATLDDKSDNSDSDAQFMSSRSSSSSLHSYGSLGEELPVVHSRHRNADTSAAAAAAEDTRRGLAARGSARAGDVSSVGPSTDHSLLQLLNASTTAAAARSSSSSSSDRKRQLLSPAPPHLVDRLRAETLRDVSYLSVDADLGVAQAHVAFRNFRLLSNAYSRWRGRLSRILAIRRELEDDKMRTISALEHWQATTCSRAFAGWKRVVRGSRAKGVQLAAAVVLRRQASIFQRWFAELRLHASNKVTLLGAVQHWAGRLLGRAFRFWHDWKARMRLMRRHCQLFRLLSVFRGWHRAWTRHRGLAQQHDAVCRRREGALLAAAFGAWQSLSLDRQWLQAREDCIARATRRSVLCVGFREWRELAQYAVETSAFARRWRLLRAVGRWRRLADAAASARSDRALATGHFVGSLFTAWQRVFVQTRERRFVMQFVRQHVLTAALASWRTALQREHRERAACRRLAVRRWLGFARARRRDRGSAREVARCSEAGAVSHAWRLWRGRFAACVGASELVLAGVQHHRLHLLRAAVAHWRRWPRKQSAAQRAQRRDQERAAGLVKRRAVAHWRQWAQSRRAVQALAAKAELAWRRRGLRRALRTLLLHGQASAGLRRRAVVVATVVARSRLSQAWSLWSRHVLASLEREREHVQSLQPLLLRRRLLLWAQEAHYERLQRRAAQRLAFLRRLRAVVRWRLRARYFQAQRLAQERVAAGVRRRVLGAALSAWHWLQRRRASLQQLVPALADMRARRCLGAWLRRTRELTAARRMSRFAERRAARHCVRRWWSTCADVLKYVIFKNKLRSALAFNQWRGNAACLARDRRVHARIVADRQSSLLTRAWAALHGAYVRGLRMQEDARDFAGFWGRRKALQGWSQLWAARGRLRATGHAVSQQCSLRLQQSAFGAWHAIARAQRESRQWACAEALSLWLLRARAAKRARALQELLVRRRASKAVRALRAFAAARMHSRGLQAFAEERRPAVQMLGAVRALRGLAARARARRAEEAALQEKAAAHHTRRCQLRTVEALSRRLWASRREQSVCRHFSARLTAAAFSLWWRFTPVVRGYRQKAETISHASACLLARGVLKLWARRAHARVHIRRLLTRAVAASKRPAERRAVNTWLERTRANRPHADKRRELAALSRNFLVYKRRSVLERWRRFVDDREARRRFFAVSSQNLRDTRMRRILIAWKTSEFYSGSS
jgi:hypothetical protein